MAIMYNVVKVVFEMTAYIYLLTTQWDDDTNKISVVLLIIQYYRYLVAVTGDRNISVGIETRCGLDGPGIESRWGRDIPNPSRPALVPNQPPVQWVPGLFRG
jgi:hypothetical protein